MKYLYLSEDGFYRQKDLASDSDIHDDDLAEVDQGTLDIICFHDGQFKQLSVTSEEVEEEADEGVEPEVNIEYGINAWTPLPEAP